MSRRIYTDQGMRVLAGYSSYDGSMFLQIGEICRNCNGEGYDNDSDDDCTACGGDGELAEGRVRLGIGDFSGRGHIYTPEHITPVIIAKGLAVPDGWDDDLERDWTDPSQNIVERDYGDLSYS